MQKLEPTAQFVLNHMLEEGGVRTNFLDTSGVFEFATGSDVLSESQGLLMKYAVETENAALFAQTYNYLQDKLVHNGALISYRYSDQYGIFPMNAAIDDLRIIRALLEAAQTFKNKSYEAKALEYAQKLYDVCVVDNHLRDFYDATWDMASSTLTLCYVDFKTLSMLSTHDSRWELVLKNGVDIVKTGYLGDAFPLFASHYSFDGTSYSTQNIDAVQAMLVTLHLAEIGECPAKTKDFIKEQVQKGTLWGSYSTNGDPQSDVQSTAIYALAAQLGAELNETELEQVAISRMMQFRVEDVEAQLYGAYGNVNTMEVFSFDNLNAMLAELC